MAVSFDYMASVLPPQLAWLVPFLPYIRPIFLSDVAAFCASEPTLPDLTGITIGAVLAGGEFGAALVAANAIQQIVSYYLWFAICQCTTGGPPTPASPPAMPTDLPAINPYPFVSPTPATPCREVTFAFHQDGPITGTAVFPVGNITLSDIHPTSLVWTQTEQQNGFSLSSRVDWQFTTDGTDPVSSGTRTTFTFSPKDSTRTFTIPSTATLLRIVAFPNVASGFSIDVTGDLKLYCGGQSPTSVATPCCPPDPIATGYLAQILDLVTLIQRQAVPFGYVAGATHTGLSGAGALSISGLLGVKVAVTTLPTSYGVQGTSPPEHFDLGFITFGVTDGFPQAYRLQRNPQVIFPCSASVYTDLDYDLAPGVVVTITELVREPA
jgi:hypothetical protein